MSPAELEREAALWGGAMYALDEPQGQPASAYAWREVAAYPIASLASAPEDWRTWFRTEVAMATEDGAPERYADLADGSPIAEPVVIVEIDGKGYLWDGYHRVGASVAHGRSTVPAIVGVPKGVRQPAT